jgi:transcriptional regulator with XRE-family HTH domain
MPTPHRPSIAVLRTLRKLGADIRNARLRRRLPMEIVARRALTSRSTLQRIESGDPGVGMGIHASVLQALGLLDGVGRLADLTVDVVGQALAESELPQRARLRSSSSLGADE